MDQYVNYLKERIGDDTPVEEIIDTFEAMCRMPIDDDMILFETGTFDFTGEPLFYFTLIRQFPNEEDEFYQICVNLLFAASEENGAFSETTWNEELSESIFDYIRKSPAYAYAKEHAYLKTMIQMYET